MCLLFLTSCASSLSAAPYSGECEDPYPSLSDYHDYEPNLEFDDSDLHQKHPEGPDGELVQINSLLPFSAISKLATAASRSYQSSISPCNFFFKRYDTNGFCLHSSFTYSLSYSLLFNWDFTTHDFGVKGPPARLHLVCVLSACRSSSREAILHGANEIQTGPRKTLTLITYLCNFPPFHLEMGKIPHSWNPARSGVHLRVLSMCVLPTTL